MEKIITIASVFLLFNLLDRIAFNTYLYFILITSNCIIPSFRYVAKLFRVAVLLLEFFELVIFLQISTRLLLRLGKRIFLIWKYINRTQMKRIKEGIKNIPFGETTRNIILKTPKIIILIKIFTLCGIFGFSTIMISGKV